MFGSLRAERQAPPPALPSSNPSHYSAYWYSIRVPNLGLHPSCVPTAVHWCDNLYMRNPHTRAQKRQMQHITAQHNSTKRAAGAPQRSSQKGRRSISRSAFAFLLAAADFSFPWSLWQRNTKKKTRLWCGEGTQVSITSPETGWRRRGRNRLGPYSLILPTEVKSFKWVELQDQ